MKKVLLLTWFLCLCASPSYANAGIPIFIALPTIIQSVFWGWPFYYFIQVFRYNLWITDDVNFDFLLSNPLDTLFSFIVMPLYGLFLLWNVVLMEYNYYLDNLTKIDSCVLKKAVWKGNILTTLLGFVFWVPSAFFVESSRVGYIVLGPIELITHTVLDRFFIFILPLYLFLLIFVCFILSHSVEASFIKKITSDYGDKEIKIAARKANRRSYWGLFLCCIFPPASFVCFFTYIIKNRKLEKQRMTQNESGKV